LAQAERLCQELSRSCLLPAAVTLGNDGASQAWQLAIWCEGFEESVARHLREATDIAARTGMAMRQLEAETRNALWIELRDFPLQTDCLIYRVTLPRAKIFECVARARNWADWSILVDIAAGTVWLASRANNIAEQFSKLIEFARERRGHAVVFAAPEDFKSGVEIWGPAPPNHSLQREIKRQFDPYGLLNPGRFWAGL
jgi:FAD/FMN-containing dehydrogenase